MKTSEVMTSFPLQITFRNGVLSPEAELRIRLEAAKLETFYSRIMGCRVEIESPHRHHRHGSPYHVRIDLTLPGGELVIKHEPSLRTRARQSGELKLKKHLEVSAPFKQLRLAIAEAFKKAGCQLQDYVRRQRGDVKHLEMPPRARITQLFPDKDYGFMVTPDGRDIYFHADSVLNNAFGRLKIGTLVSFAEEQGERGPQASTVKIVGKQGPRPARTQSVTAMNAARHEQTAQPLQDSMGQEQAGAEKQAGKR
jgi:cold shock CspA family protein